MKIRLVDLLLLAALICGVSFYFTHWIDVPHWPKVVWKGSCVGLLSAWAFARQRPWIGLALALAAIGDMLLEAVGLVVGAIPFLMGHIVAAGLYWRSARTGAMVPAGIAAAVVVASYWLSGGDRGIAVYAIGLGLMAGTALVSRFRLAGFGAILFVVSDLLIFSLGGPYAGSDLPGVTIWPTYFVGQALIAWSVVWSERREDLYDRL